MTKNQFREFILNRNISSVVVISCPDYNGGRQLKVYINKDKYDIELDDFEYVEYEANDKNTIVKDRKCKFSEKFESQYEYPYEIEYTLEKLLLSFKL